MAKIPIILEPGRADGKLATANSIFDENKSMFQSELNDIQDTLNSDNPNKPLSANQGRILKEIIDAKVIEVGAVPIDAEPIEGNTTHVVNSDGLAKEFNKCNTEIILGGVYDVSSHNNEAVFESLQSLLSNADLNTLIPTSVRHGGMSIRFVQSSDNKYVQYRLMVDEFTTDITQWAIADKDVYVENPEFVYVKTDNEGKILWAIKIDGSIYYGAGVPQQVKEYINEKIGDLSLDEYEDIVTFLNDYLGSDSTLMDIIGEWNNTVPGKKISILGDSISTFNQEGYKIEGYSMYYPTEANDRGVDVTTVNDTWWMQVINNIAGTLEVNASFSGSTASSRNIGFSPRVPLLGNPDIIYVALGSNDSGNGVTVGEINFEAETYDLTQFAPAYIKGMQDTIAAYPKAKIVCVAFDMDTDYQNAIKTIAEHYDAEYIYVGDISVVHPNKAEMTAVANRIIPSAKYTITDAIKTLSCSKVDKETGKSLIDTDYASSQSAIDNSEYLQVITDSDDKILEGIKSDGTKILGGDLNIGGSAKILGEMWVAGVTYKVIENLEYLVAWVDAEDKVLFGLKTDGKTYVGDADFLNNIKNNQEAIAEIKATLVTIGAKLDSINIDVLSLITVIESPEYIEVTTDSEGKILAGRTLDGIAFENIGFSTTKAFTELVNIDGATIENIEDLEGRTEIKTDSEGKILSYRDAQGIIHENVGIESKSITTDSIHLTSNGMTKFQQALIENGFNPKMPIDWSDEKELHLPIPRTCAKVNLIVENLPTSKTANYSAMLEYSDLDGNYFKKPIILNAQGSSSMAYIEKNLGFDFNDGSEIQFGNWVSQDSFHLKCYYIDVFRGEANICYNYTNEVIKYLNCRANRVLNDNSATTTSNGIGKFNKDFGSSALCQPDGFPIEVYHNGTYYGLFAWNLKKNRKNYQMKKDNYFQALMDGEINYSSFFGGTINWRLFELRNPKTLYLMDGVTKYDGENPKEIISPTMIVDGQEVPNPNYDANNSNHVKTYQTKAMLEELSQVIPTLNGMTIDTQEGLQAAKTLYEEHFDKDMMICYFILSNVLFHPDGFNKNWIWTIYNGIAAPTFYDMDTMFGRYWTGGKMWPGYNTSSILGNDVSQPCGQLYRLYRTDIETVYADLRAKKYIDVDYIISFFNDWLNRQTIEAVERNIKKWTAIPSYRENNGNYPPPLSYDDSVQTEGMYDSIGRVKKWLEKRIPALDIFFNYNQN